MMILFVLALVVYVLVCAVLVALILMQEGKGGGLSGVMGSSMGETFGFGGASKQIRKYTAVCSGVFLVLTIILTFLAESVLHNTANQFLSGGSSTPATATVPATAPVGEAGAPPAGAEAPSPGQVAPAPAPEAATESAPAAPAESVPPPAATPAQ